MIFKRTFHWVTTAVHFGQMRTIVECHRFLWNTFCSCSYYCQYYYCVATCAHLTEVPDPTTLLKKKTLQQQQNVVYPGLFNSRNEKEQLLQAFLQRLHVLFLSLLVIFQFFFLQPSFIHRCFTSAFNCVIHCVNERLATAHSVTC